MNSSKTLGTDQSTYDFTKSNLILMVGGQILILAFLLMIVFFGTAPLTSPIATVQKIINSKNAIQT